MAEDGKIVYKVHIDDTGIQTTAENSGKTAGSSWGAGFDENAQAAIAAAAGKVGTAISNAANTAWELINRSVTETAARGDKIGHGAADIAWENVEAYQAWDYVLTKNGTSMEQMARGIKTLTGATSGTTDAQAEAFNALGLSLEQVQSMKPEDLFASVIAGLQQIGDLGQRQDIAKTLFGGSANQLGELLNSSGEDVEALMQEITQLGGILSSDAVSNAMAYTDSMESLDKSLEGIGATIGETVMPLITALTDDLVDLVTNHGDEIVGWIEAVGGALIAWKGITAVAGIVTSLQQMYSSLVLLAGLLGISGTALAAGAGGVGLAAVGVYSAVQQVKDLNTVGYLGEGHSLDEYKQNAEAAQAALDAWHEKNDEYMNSGYTEGLEGLQAEQDRLAIAVVHAKEEYEAAQAAAEEYGAALEETAPKAEEFADGSGEALESGVEAGTQAMEEFATASGELRTDFEQGTGELSGVAAEQAEEVNTTMGHNMEILANNADIWGYDFMIALANGMVRGFNEGVLPALTGVTETMSSMLHHSEPDIGPLSDDNDWMPDMMRTFAKGITDNAGLLEDAIGESFNFAPMINGAVGSLDMERSASGSIAAGRPSPLQIIVPLTLNGNEIARATAWAMGEQLSWEMM